MLLAAVALAAIAAVRIGIVVLLLLGERRTFVVVVAVVDLVVGIFLS